MNLTEEDRCKSKIRYSNEMQASVGAGRMKFNYSGFENIRLRTYQCGVCLGWHVTKRPFDDYAVRLQHRVRAMLKNI